MNLLQSPLHVTKRKKKIITQIIPDDDFNYIFDNLIVNNMQNISLTTQNKTIEDSGVDFLSAIDLTVEETIDGNDENMIINNNLNNKKTKDKDLEVINELAKDINQETWSLHQTENKKAKEGVSFKLFSLGHVYNCYKKTETQYYWRCCNYHKGCKGRAVSNCLIPPLTMTKLHDSNVCAIDNAKNDKIKANKMIKDKAISCYDDPRTILIDIYKQFNEDSLIQFPNLKAQAKQIRRLRRKKRGDFTYKSLADLKIPEQLQYTHRNHKFLFDDSGCGSSNNRILIFTTEKNLQILDKYGETWFCDGTFDISPTLFKQVYTIHAMFRNKTLPLVYAILPNKKQKTYKYLFKTIKKSIKTYPKFINCDFELAAINAFKNIFKEAKVYGCYFHFSQAILRKCKQLGGTKSYYKDKDLRKLQKELQSLAYVRIHDVPTAFLNIKDNSPTKFKTIINYFEKTYIGYTTTQKIGRSNKTVTFKPRFDISIWNIHDRILSDIPTTNNNVESWHSVIKKQARQNMSVGSLIDLLKKEQSNMEYELGQLLVGDNISYKPSKDKLEKSRKIKKTLEDYDTVNLDDFLLIIYKIIIM